MNLNVSRIEPHYKGEFYRKGISCKFNSEDDGTNSLQGCLYIQLVALRVIPHTLNVNAETNFRPHIDPWLKMLDSERVIDRVQCLKWAPMNILILAKTLIRLGRRYQFSKEFSIETTENNRRFDFLFGAAEGLLMLKEPFTAVQTKLAVSKELHDYDLLVKPFMDKRKKPQ